MPSGNWKTFWPVLIAIVASDVATKFVAVRSLVPERVPREVLGDWLRFTLVYNPGAAFGLHVGDHSRWVFTVLTIGALLILGRLYVATTEGHFTRVVSLALVCGGALGNLLDRIRSARGVVDFVDVGLGDARWPTFNVADMAVSVGAFLLAVVLWADDQAGERSDAMTLAVAPAELRHEPGDAT